METLDPKKPKKVVKLPVAAVVNTDAPTDGAKAKVSTLLATLTSNAEKTGDGDPEAPPSASEEIAAEGKFETMKGTDKGSFYIVVGQKFGARLGVKAYNMVAWGVNEAGVKVPEFYFAARVRVEGGEPKDAAKTFAIPSLAFKGKHSSGMIGIKAVVGPFVPPAAKAEFYGKQGPEEFVAQLFAHLAFNSADVQISAADLIDVLKAGWDKNIPSVAMGAAVSAYKLELDLKG